MVPAPANYYVYSGSTIGELAGLSSFTLTGWLNSRSNTTGTGGNRIMSWLRPSGEGVELVYQSDGSLRLGVDEPAGGTSAISTAGKVTTDTNAGAANWVFFAVTYQQTTGQVQYYFGNNTSDATLDATKAYPGRGNVGGNIGPLTFGAFNNEAGTDPVYDRMFRGIIDNFRIYGSSLSLTDIRAVQHAASSDVTLPSAPSGLAVSENTGTSVKLTWTSSTDNVAVVGYNIFNGSALIETSVGTSTFAYVNGLTPGTTYDFSVRARDAAGNLSTPTAISVKAVKVPLIYFGFSGEISSLEYNGGSLGQRFIAGTQVTNTPRGGGRYALSGFVRSLETDYIFDGLKNLSSFTIAGWVNRTSNSSNESIFTWMPNGSGDGVDLIIQPDGSLRLGVDGVATSSPAFSNANKITTNTTASFDNWTFFAVTYQAGGQAQFYFGNNTVSASLDKSVIYSAPGNTGSNIGPVSIKSPVGGVIDSPILYGSVLTLEEIRALQFGPEDNEPPTSPGVLTVTGISTTNVGIAWSDISTDNFGVTSYDVFDGSTMLYRYVPTGGRYDPNPQDATVYPLTPGTTYHLYVKARDSWGNYSAPTNTVTVTTLSDTPTPLVWLKLDENTGVGASNSGSSAASFSRSPAVPAASDNVPTGIASVKSADYGTSSANAYVESTTPINELKNLSGFTITGWVNNRSSVMGSGGNRIASWVNNGGEGVDLVYKNNGALQLGVDQWPDFSPAISSPNKVTTNASAPASNWVFFAVTYTDAGSVQFYFGTTSASATLDVTKSYPGRGAVGSNIAKLAIGNFNDATRNNLPAFDRVFRGMIDDIRVYGSVLTQQQIVEIQGLGGSSGARMAMTPEPTINDETTDLPVLTQNYPNPFESGTTIEVNISRSVRVARITVSDITGRSMQSIEVEGRGPTSVAVSAEGLNSGVYIYTLMTDGKVVGFKRMMVRK
ncbi:MAG: fibronectin type III domain-containing protein [Chryseolinea sp.]